MTYPTIQSHTAESVRDAFIRSFHESLPVGTNCIEADAQVVFWLTGLVVPANRTGKIFVQWMTEGREEPCAYTLRCTRTKVVWPGTYDENRPVAVDTVDIALELTPLQMITELKSTYDVLDLMGKGYTMKEES